MNARLAIRWLLGLGTAAVVTLAPCLSGAEPAPADPTRDAASKLSDEKLQELIKRYADDRREFTPNAKKRLQEEGYKQLVEELRRRFPYESLAPRLAYEAEHARRDPKSTTAPKLSEAVAKQLEDQEKSGGRVWRWDKRVESLRMLHTDEVEKFVTREGFGRTRAPEPSLHYFQLPKSVPLPLATLPALTPEQVGVETALPKTAVAGAAGHMPSVEQVTALHRGSQLDFLNPDYFGHIKNREQVTGFQPHQFRYPPRLEPPVDKKQPADAKEGWQLRRLELVSLLKHEQPAVYVSEHLPRMDQLAKAKVRPLTAFEEQGLKALREGEELKTEATTNVIRMLGAVRAAKQCLDCHAVERGQLLGAFTYEMQRDPPAAATR